MVRKVSFQYVVVRNGADYMTLQEIEGSEPTIRMDADGEIKTSFSGSFEDPGDTVDWLSDEIRPEMIIDETTYPLGVFLPGSVMHSESETTKSVRIEAYDRCWQVKDIKTSSPEYFAAGVNYISAIEQLLTQAGIASISATPTSATLAEARADWSLGTDYLSIINQLLGEINYKDLWFNASGAAVLEPAEVPSAQNIQHTIDADDPAALLLPDNSRELDVYNAPNVFVVVCSNPDKSAVMIARSENTNPQSPLSIPRRGRSIMMVEQVDNIADQNALQAYADKLRNQSMITGETISIRTGLLPGFGVDDVTAIQLDDLMAICRERAWSMQLRAGGVMSHTLERVVINIG